MKAYHSTPAKILLKIKIEEAQAQYKVGLITEPEMLRLICQAKTRWMK